MDRKKIKRIPLTIPELNELERDLVAGIEDKCDDKEVVLRATRLVGNKISFLRSVVRAQGWLEKSDLAEFY